MKHDVLPGRYTSLWFEATRAGAFHLFCAEYCGTQHSLMKGRVVVLEPAEYQAWLAGNQAGANAGRRRRRRCSRNALRRRVIAPPGPDRRAARRWKACLVPR